MAGILRNVIKALGLEEKKDLRRLGKDSKTERWNKNGNTSIFWERQVLNVLND